MTAVLLARIEAFVSKVGAGIDLNEISQESYDVVNEIAGAHDLLKKLIEARGLTEAGEKLAMQVLDTHDQWLDELIGDMS